MLLHLRDHVPVVGGDAQRTVDLGKLAGEERVDDDALHFDQLADVLAVLLVRHASPGEMTRVRGGAGVTSARSVPGVYRSPFASESPGDWPSACRPRSPPPGRRGRGFRRTR